MAAGAIEKLAPFSHPDITAKGERRAQVLPSGMRTLWFNTGTLCNIECGNCYILSSPTNDALVYLTLPEVERFLDEVGERNAASPARWQVDEIGFTGGEPFMNPDAIGMAEAALERGFRVLILTNAMAPMMRPRVRNGLADLQARFRERLTLRISIDHYSEDFHDQERGRGSFEKTLAGMRWLSEQGIHMDAAGRTCWNEDEAAARAGYAALFAREGFDIDAYDPARCILFPEMDAAVEVPEITTDCWGILGKSPAEVMCASSRMVVKRKGAAAPCVLACTLLAYDERFEMGTSLVEADRPVKLNHPHCAKFCVLGGGSCTG